MREARSKESTSGESGAPDFDRPYADVRDEMGAAFGADFSGVEIERDGAADALGAQAYTQGDTIHLGTGRGDPATDEGRALLGHEFAHVVQQREGRVDAPQGKDAPVVADAALEAEADEAGARAARGEAVPDSARARGGTGGGAIQAKGNDQPIQMFGTREHMSLGDEGSAGVTTGYQWKTQGDKDPSKQVGPAGFKFVLTHGDIVALSGDYFDPRDNDENGKPIPDSLFRLASTPSPDPGKVVGTQDEILYALKKHGGNDPRFKPECTPEQPSAHPYSLLEFSPEVEKAVEDRYLRLASRNDEHFQQPGGPTSGGPDSGNRASGGGSYRELHEDAILRAYRSKTTGGAVTGAMAREAAAQHFLTDAFAAGHARTPRGSIRSHWQAKYPTFFSNMKKAIAHETAIWINDHDTNAATILGSVQDVMASIYDKVQAQTKDLPSFGFDDVVSLVVHDIDNEQGLWVTNDLGDSWKTYGDGSLDQGETKEKALLAVRLGCEDIRNAHSLEQSLDDDAVLAAVRERTPAPAAPADKYGPEQVVPRLDPSKADENGKQNWEADSFESLWNLPVRTDDPTTTFQTVITESLQGGELNDKLSGLADKFPESEKVYKGGVYLGTVHPRSGYTEGFLRPVIDNPFQGMRRIIHYDPSRGQSFNNTDDAIMEDFERMEAEDQEAGAAAGTSMRGLTLEQRVKRTRELLEGYTGGDEGERIVEMFETASRADALALYRRIEGHEWNGDFRQGWFTIDDDLWDDLSSGQLDRIRSHLNG